MNISIKRMASVFVVTAAFGIFADAQVKQTANTLKLADGAARPKATIADLKPLIGNWRGDFMGAGADETWLEPAGGAMIGMFRMYTKDKPGFYEFWAAFEEEGSVTMRLKHFNPDMKGWEEKDGFVTFKFVKADASTVWFEGLTYSRQKDGSLRGYVALKQKDGSIKEEVFTFRPVP